MSDYQRRITRQLFVSLGFLLLVESGYSQSATAINSNNSRNPALYDITEKIKNFKSEENILGHPYLVDYWQKGEVKDVKGNKYGNMDLKYNLKDNQLIYKDLTTGDSTVLKNSMVQEFVIFAGNDSVTVFKNFTDRNVKGATIGFCQIIYDKGKSKLIKQRSKVIIRQDGTSPASNANTESGAYRLLESYYLAKNNGKFCKLKNNQKSLLRCFDEYQNDLKSYIKKEKLNVKKQQDLIKAIAYYDRLH